MKNIQKLEEYLQTWNLFLSHLDQLDFVVLRAYF